MSLQWMDGFVKVFPQVLEPFNKNKWLWCSLCQKHYCDSLGCRRKHKSEHQNVIKSVYHRDQFTDLV
jgi:hypothetical protein